MLERMERLEPLEPEAAEIAFRFKLAEQPGRDILHLTGLGKRYGAIELLNNAECHLMRGDKVGLVGANGTGKSTLLRLLAGVEAGEGQRTEGLRTRISMFAQHQLEDLNPGNTILEELAAYAREFGETYLRTVLGGFMFSGDEVTKQIGVLSGGERARVALAKALLSEANVLMLDEPTNHLDIPSIEVLIKALQNYQGTYVVISHNRHFLRHVTNKTWTIEDQQIKEYPGSYEEYEYSRAQRAKLASHAQKPEAPKPEPKPEPKAEAKPARPQSRDIRQLQNRLKGIETDIARLESQRDKLKAELASPALASDFHKLASLQVEIDTLNTQLDGKMDEWAAVSEELEAAV
jgi:ATP-binding cassette subfamily F protein 3